MHSVLKSEVLHLNIKELSETDAVKNMYDDLVSIGYNPKSEMENNGSHFMSKSNSAYRKYSTEADPHPITIGSVAEALILLGTNKEVI